MAQCFMTEYYWMYFSYHVLWKWTVLSPVSSSRAPPKALRKSIIWWKLSFKLINVSCGVIHASFMVTRDCSRRVVGHRNLLLQESAAFIEANILCSTIEDCLVTPCRLRNSDQLLNQHFSDTVTTAWRIHNHVFDMTHWFAPMDKFVLYEKSCTGY